ncbi:hypothetical protein HBB16_06505 [Pseudonocardia sp. MCCB 268]|nr:hypothetical protein [Pseudonocardia cytotoxica]
MLARVSDGQRRHGVARRPPSRSPRTTRFALVGFRLGTAGGIRRSSSVRPRPAGVARGRRRRPGAGRWSTAGNVYGSSWCRAGGNSLRMTARARRWSRRPGRS